MNLEQIGGILLATGIVCFFIAALWIWFVSWRVSWKWGLGITLFAPAVFVFVPKHFARVRTPVWLFILSLAFMGIPFAVNAVAQKIDLGPREKIVEGDVHLTLTGWDQKDYSFLKQKPDVVVLQMANADVTDETLEFIQDAKQLTELDLNDTQITDQGLAILKNLPKLSRLRLRGTKITDEGFQRELGEKETLLELDVRETAITSKTMREWKNARDGRNYLN